MNVINVPRNMVLDFGKRRGLSASWIAQNDLPYALWLMSQRFVRERPQLWLCLRKHVTAVFQQQEAEHDAGSVA